MKPLNIVTLITAAIVLLMGVSVTQAQSDVPRFEPDVCSFGEQPQIECGWLIVPEDHRQPEGPTIRLAVAILKSASPTPQPDSLVFLNGGPGSATVAFTPQLAAVFGAFLSQRDMILFDQRGVGLSQPALECPAFAELAVLPLDPDESLTRGQQVVSDCRSRLAGQGINLDAYNTVQNAADVADLRVALGLEQVNLLGASYGTELALTVLRDHPQGIRSVILASTKPPQEALYAHSAANFDRAFQLMVEACDADLQCRLAYPNLRETYVQLVDRLNAAPADVHVEIAGRSLDVQVSGDILADQVFIMLYDSNAMRYVPALIDTMNRGEYDSLRTMPIGATQAIAESISYGAFFSTVCSEDAAVISPPASPPAFNSTIFGSAGYSLCQAWGIPAPGNVENAPVISDIPTLVLAGQFDPVTPPAWGQEVSENLSHSVFVEFPGLGHSVAAQPCPLSIATAFLAQPDAAPDTTCAQDLRPPQFIVTAAATRPVTLAGAALLAGVSLWAVGSAALSFRRNPRWIAWRPALRTVGWIGAAVTAGVLLLLILPGDTQTMFPWASRARLVEAIVPLAMGIQAALLFSPDDEPALEVLLALPRQISWLLLERLAALALAETGIALLGIGLTLALKPDQDVGLALVRWIPPAVFLSGIGVYVTLRSRVASFGLICAGLIWFACIFFGAALLPGQPTFWPLSVIQPYLWPLHAYLQPGDLAASDYLLNRLFITVTGLSLIALAAYQLQDEERVLLGGKKAKKT